MITEAPDPLDCAFWSKWQRINGNELSPSYGRAWTPVQKEIYLREPQVKCRQWFDGEHREFMYRNGEL